MAPPDPAPNLPFVFFPMAPSLAPFAALLAIGAVGLSPAWSQQEQPSPAQQPAQVQSAPQQASPGAANALSDKEKALLDKIRALKAPRWRSFGRCRYDWSAWRLAPEGVRTTSMECGTPPVVESVAVHCATLKISQRAGDQPWSAWRLPLASSESSSRGGEDLMVAALCANAQLIAEPIKPPPATPSKQPATVAKPAAKAKPATTAQPGSAVRPR